MQRNHIHMFILLAGVLLAGCEGSNMFLTQPIIGRERLLGSIEGHVTAVGAGVPGAFISLADSTTARTDAAGRYRLNRLEPAAYRVFLRIPPGFELVPGDSAVRIANVTLGDTEIVNWELLQAAGAI